MVKQKISPLQKIRSRPQREVTNPSSSQSQKENQYFVARTSVFPPQERQQIISMNCVLKKRVSKQNDDIKAESSTKREASRKVSSIVYTRAQALTRSPAYLPPMTRVTSQSEDDELIIDPHPFYKRNPQRRKERRKPKLKEYSRKVRAIFSSPLPPMTSVVFKMFSFLTMKYIPQTAFQSPFNRTED